jgi:hypothetical protein
MSLQELASFAEIVSALAVVVSLLYLAKQVKIANDLNRTDTFRDIIYSMTAHLNLMFSVENVSLTIKGFQAYSSLAADEKLRFEHLMAGLFQHTEDSWNSIEAGIIGADLKENWTWFLKEKFFPYRGVREWWADYKPAYAPDFQNWIDSIELDANHDGDPYNIK